jgi:signal peptidase II
MKRHLLLLSLFVILIDQLSKTVIAHTLSPSESVKVLGDFFRITYVLNPGGAFGTRIGSGTFYTAISIFAIFLGIYFFLKTRENETWFRIGWTLILGGASGNLIDRFRFGEVLDFLDFDFFNIYIPPIIQLDRWPVFNLADASVTVAMIIILWQVLFHKKQTKPETVEDEKEKI